MTQAHGLFRDHPPPSKQVLLDWLQRERAYIHPGIRVADVPGAGWGMVAESVLEPHELLFNIPVTAILSTRTSSLPNVPSSSRKSTSGPILDLALCVLHELRLEEESRWYGYLQSLPRETVLLPVMWEISELCGEDGRQGLGWLRGTEAARDLSTKKKDGCSLRDLEAYYSTHSGNLPPTKTHPEESSFLAYLHAFSLVTTRAFLIDLYHTVALVPFADILNHSSSSPHTSLSSDSFVCHICGSLPPCEHDILASNDIPYRLQEASRDWEDYQRMISHKNTVEMRMEASARPGDEICNSYGTNISDARLLVEWGYLGEEYAGDGLTWDRKSLGGDGSTRKAWLSILPFRQSWSFPTDQAPELGIATEDRLLFDGSSDARGADLFNLSQSGQINSNIWVYEFLAVTRGQPSSAEEAKGTCEQVKGSIDNTERCWASLHVEDDSGDIERSKMSDIEVTIARRICRLLEDRLAHLKGAELSLDDLFEKRDSLLPDSPLHGMALSLCINERILLETSLNGWRELLEEHRHT